MSEQEIIALRREVAELRESLAQLQQDSADHFDLFTQHIGDQHRDLEDLFSYVMPIMQKLYPGFTASKKQYDQILNRPAPPNDSGPGPKSS
jgi:hypothetical protein